MEGWVLVSHSSHLDVRPLESAECNNLLGSLSPWPFPLRELFSLAGLWLPQIGCSLELSILGHQTSCYESAGLAFSTGLWRQLPTQCVFAGSREGTFSPTHVPKYLLYQACDVWDCFPVDKAFHSTMKAPKIEVNAHVFGIAHNKLFLASRSDLCCSLCQEYLPHALISLTLIL